MATVVFGLADRVVHRVARWDLKRGTFPDPRICRCRLRFVGVPLIYCNKARASLLTSSFVAVMVGTISLATEGDMVKLAVTVQVSGPLVTPMVLTIQIDGEVFPITVHLRRSAQGSPVLEEEEELDIGVVAPS